MIGLLLAVSAMSCDSATDPPGRNSAEQGPLTLPDGYRAVMAPSQRRTFMTLTTCVEGADDLELVVNRVEALDRWSDAELTWKVAWPTASTPVRVGSAAGPAPGRFAELPGRGRPAPCGGGTSSPVLAVEFPRTRSVHIGFDALRVHYSVNGEDHVADYDVGMGICAAGDPDPQGRCAGN